MPLCSIVISTYERPESLSRCLEAIARQREVGEAEVIVVDDGSRVDARGIVRNWKSKLDFRFIRIEHMGRAGARNRGVAAAKAPRIVFVDDDIMVRPGWLARHLEQAGDPNVAVLGPYPLNARHGGADRTSEAFRNFLDPVKFERIGDPSNVDFAFFATGNVSIDRETFNRIGGFDERFRRYGWEDIDLGYRFVRAGGRIVFDDQAKAIHNHRPMGRRDLYEREISVGVTAYQFWDKWRNDEVAFMKFWDEDSRPGPAWRRGLGRLSVEVLERVAPNSALLAKCYERLVYSYRHVGVCEGRRLRESSRSNGGDGAA